MDEIISQNEYKNFILEVSTKIKQTQIKLAVVVNSRLIYFCTNAIVQRSVGLLHEILFFMPWRYHNDTN